MVMVEDTCLKGHKSKRRCSQDPAGLPCHPCKREAEAIQREVDRDAAAKAAREREREAATARLAEARRAAAQEREKLAHETELLRLERETQRAEVDAERTRTSQRGARSNLQGARDAAAAASAAVAATSAATAEAHSGKARGLPSTAIATTTKKSKNPKTSTAIAGGPLSSPQKTIAAKTRKRKLKDENASRTTRQEGSTLLLVAQAAAKGDARGITDALRAVPAGQQQEQASHALAVAIGASAHDWFLPKSGGESSPVGPPTPRAAQALGMMAKGEWVKARGVLAAIVQDTTTKQGAGDSPAASVGGKEAKRAEPFAVFALALCDHHLSGGSNSAAADQRLAGLEAAQLEIWPGPPDSRPPPSARAFPLGALVRAYLLAAYAAPSAPQQGCGEDGETSTAAAPAEDPRARACSLAVSFLRAPAHARKVGRVDSPSWTAAAEALIRENGSFLAEELWGPEEGSGGGIPVSGGGGGGGGDDDDDALLAQWQRLQAKWGISSEGMDSLLEMSGLDAIKTEFLTVAKLTIVNKERGYDPSSGSFNVRLEGNPGTGERIATGKQRAVEKTASKQTSSLL